MTYVGCGDDVNLSRISTRTFCLRCAPCCETHNCFREQMCYILMCAPRMRQLALSDSREEWEMRERATRVLPLAAFSALSDLVYLEFLDGLMLVDLRQLLNPIPPPDFAAQLTHLALRVQWQDISDAAALLASLPSIYQSLMHVHVGVKQQPDNDLLIECAECAGITSRYGFDLVRESGRCVAWREAVIWTSAAECRRNV